MGLRSFKKKSVSVGRKFNGRKSIEDMYNNAAWVNYRRRFLSINRRCYRCGVSASVVDHLVPHKGDEVLFKKLDNHIALCIGCHNTATSLFDRRYVVGAPITAKVKWINWMRDKLGLDFRSVVLPRYEN